MNRKLHKHLKSAFDPPPPPRKLAFLQGFNQPRLSKRAFVKSQLAYTSRLALACYAILALIIVSTGILDKTFDAYAIDGLMVASSFLPFLAVVLTNQLLKSRAYKMQELEMACRFNHSDLVITRLWIHASISLLMIIFLSAMLHYKSPQPWLEFSILLYSPLLLTSFLTLLTINRLNIRETPYICGGLACFVSLGNLCFQDSYTPLLKQDNFVKVTFMLLFLGLVTWQTHKYFKRLEEEKCPLSLMA